MLDISDFQELKNSGFKIKQVSDTHFIAKNGKFKISITEDEDDEDQVELKCFYGSKEFYEVWTGNEGNMIEEAINDCFDAYEEEDFD